MARLYPSPAGRAYGAEVAQTSCCGGTAYRFRAPHLGMGRRWPVDFLIASWPAYAALGAGALVLHCLKRGG